MRNRLSDEQGFTLIELLVVILIIGILAAIALPNFIGQRSRGQDAGAKSNARNLVSHVEACVTDNPAAGYVGCDSSAELGTNLGVTWGTGPGQASVTLAATDSWTIAARSDSGNTFRIAKDSNGNITRTCSVASSNRGACPGTGTSDGTW